MGNHDVRRHTLSFRAQHGTVVQPVAERTSYGKTVLLFTRNVSAFLHYYEYKPFFLLV